MKNICIDLRSGQKVKCIKEDPLDEAFHVSGPLRWNIGDELIVDSISFRPWGIFINDAEGHNIEISRVAIVE